MPSQARTFMWIRKHGGAARVDRRFLFWRVGGHACETHKHTQTQTFNLSSLTVLNVTHAPTFRIITKEDALSHHVGLLFTVMTPEHPTAFLGSA